jgi:hypothetical protein
MGQQWQCDQQQQRLGCHICSKQWLELGGQRLGPD